MPRSLARRGDASGPSRRASVRLLASLPLVLAGCGREPAAPPAPAPRVKSDRATLARLVQLPAEVAAAQWQTGRFAAHGEDWWLAAVLENAPGRQAPLLVGDASPGALDMPPGLVLEGAFEALATLPGAQVREGGPLHLPADVYGVAPFARSPLLNGQAIRLSGTRVFVLLWTT